MARNSYGGGGNYPFPQVDFSWLGGLPARAREARINEARGAAFEDLDSNDANSLERASRRLFQAQDFEGGYKLNQAALARRQLAQKSAQDDLYAKMYPEILKSLRGGSKDPQAGLFQDFPPPPPQQPDTPAEPPPMQPLPGGGVTRPFPAPVPPPPPRAEAPPPEDPTRISQALAPPEPIRPGPAEARAIPAPAGGRVVPDVPPIPAPVEPPPPAPPPPQMAQAPPALPQVPQRVPSGLPPGLPPGMDIAPLQPQDRPTPARVPPNPQDVPPQPPQPGQYPTAGDRANVWQDALQARNRLFMLPKGAPPAAVQGAMADYRAALARMQLPGDQYDYQLDLAQRHRAGEKWISFSDWKLENQVAPETYKEMIKYSEDIRKQGTAGEKLYQGAQVLRQIAEDPRFFSGTGSQFGLKMIQAGQNLVGLARAVGVPEENIPKIDANWVKSGQLVENFNALSNQIVVATLGGLGNNISNTDRDFISSAHPSLLLSKEGNKLLIEFVEAKAKRDIEAAKLVRDYRNEAKSRATAPKIEKLVQDYAEANPILKDKDGNLTPFGKRLQAEIENPNKPETGTAPWGYGHYTPEPIRSGVKAFKEGAGQAADVINQGIAAVEGAVGSAADTVMAGARKVLGYIPGTEGNRKATAQDILNNNSDWLPENAVVIKNKEGKRFIHVPGTKTMVPVQDE